MSGTQHRASDGIKPRIIVAVAPVAHKGAFLPDGCLNPITPEQIADEAVRCRDAGATVIHLHVRDRSGAIVADPKIFTETLDLVADRTRLLVNGSTGGESTLSREERCVAVNDPRVGIASLNMGSTNFGDGVYVNTVADIRYWAKRIRDAGAVPELETFGLGMIQTARELLSEGVLSNPLHFNFCLGFPGAVPATARHLTRFLDFLAPEETWGFVHEGMTDLSLVAAALGLGASVLRVGFEDGGYIARDRVARTNAELVEALVKLIRAAGAEPASHEDAEAYFAAPGVSA